MQGDRGRGDETERITNGRKPRFGLEIENSTTCVFVPHLIKRDVFELYRKQETYLWIGSDREIEGRKIGSRKCSL